MNIAIASDHAGFDYKEEIKRWLEFHGDGVIDFGAFSDAPVDYPDFVHPCAVAVSDGTADRGIALGGSGNGEAMAANRHTGIRCALCWNVESTELARKHNDANMISLGQRMLNLESASEIVRRWLTTPFDGGRHERRIKLIDQWRS